MSSAHRLEECARDLLAQSPHWRTVHAQYSPALSARDNEIFRADGFDEEYWGVTAPGGVLELWFSERGRRRRVFRTGDADAFVAKVVLDGLKRQGKRLWRACEFDEKPFGFRVETLPGNQGVLFEWGEDSWAEFLGPFQLSTALTLGHFLNATPEDISAAVTSQDGAPLLQRASRATSCGPEADSRGEITVESWERWLREREGAQHDE